MRYVAAAVVLATLWGLCASAAAQKYVYKIATLAPGKSSWMKNMRAMAREVKKLSNGRVILKFYPGGVMGDENLIVTKMEDGQIQGAAVTSVGLTKIAPATLVQQLPFLFHSYKQLDCTRKKIGHKLIGFLEEKGYKFLGYGDMGFIYLFSNKPVAKLEDIKGTKPWGWADDPMGRAFLEHVGVTPKNLSVPDVLSSLQTQLIDTVYNSPYAAIALQWFTQVKYMTKMPLAMGVGAIVVKKSLFDSMPSDLQEILTKSGEKWTRRVIAAVRRDNRNAIKVLKENGIQIVEVEAQAKKEFGSIARRFWNTFIGSHYSAEFLEEFKKTVRSCR
jgi:TRAP-type C4-dicarboxylate transport system substrate-binding protein